MKKCGHLLPPPPAPLGLNMFDFLKNDGRLFFTFDHGGIIQGADSNFHWDRQEKVRDEK